ncbi:hypothetical protein L5F37_07190 [Aliarcobacter butzleri]|uniref:hypothetical protein n=1 Tax=Aliarcobacter butzleri TaxID=28197 RepID=UPI001EDB5167|nr:hypothetical protein [Aliarcobacter butzleri]MCG3663178.1 hypothetical protein [Aliarcobacter butzleri]
MNMVSKKFLLATTLITTITILLALQIHTFLNRPANSSTTSKSGRYLMENVHVNGILVGFEKLGYLRITDKEIPEAVFRSPLYDLQSLDMQSYEDNLTVGIVWVDFLKIEQSFIIASPNWSEHWLNIFISNTPYEVIEN